MSGEERVELSESRGEGGGVTDQGRALSLCAGSQTLPAPGRDLFLSLGRQQIYKYQLTADTREGVKN